MFSLHNNPNEYQEKQAIRAIAKSLLSGLMVDFVATATIQLKASSPIPKLVPNGDHGIEAVVITSPANCILLGRPKK